MAMWLSYTIFGFRLAQIFCTNHNLLLSPTKPFMEFPPNSYTYAICPKIMALSIYIILTNKRKDIQYVRIFHKFY